MECSKSFLNLSQVVVNSLKEGLHIGSYYCFSKPEEAKHLIRILDLFCDVTRNYVEVSFYNDPDKDKIIALRVFNKQLGSNKPLIAYLDNDVEKFLSDVKIGKTPDGLREIVRVNFF